MTTDTKKKTIIGFVVLLMIIGAFAEEKPQEENTKKEIKESIKKEVKQEPAKVTYNEIHGALVKSFSYSLQAGSICDNLNMRLDTEKKINDKIGTKARGGIYNKDSMIGITSAIRDDEEGILCEQAWLHFGCDGDIEAKLLQGNPFKLQNPMLCEY